MLVEFSFSVRDVTQDNHSHILVRIHFHNTKDYVGQCPSTCFAKVDGDDAAGAVVVVVVAAAAAAAHEAFDTASTSLLVALQVKWEYCSRSNHWDSC